MLETAPTNATGIDLETVSYPPPYESGSNVPKDDRQDHKSDCGGVPDHAQLRVHGQVGPDNIFRRHADHARGFAQSHLLTTPILESSLSFGLSMEFDEDSCGHCSFTGFVSSLFCIDFRNQAL